MAGCVTGKKMYLTRTMAEQALIGAWVKNDYPSGAGPVAVYRCEDCKQFHLTSTGSMDPTLAAFIRDGKLKLEKEAAYWAAKFKK
jgi:hypothetical protein